MEFVKELPPIDEGTRIVRIRQYANVSSNDLPELRSEAATWAFNRDLTTLEHDQIIRVAAIPLANDVSQRESVVQEEPLIKLIVNPRGLTGEQFGDRIKGGRSSLLQYIGNDIRQGIGIVRVNCFQYRQAVVFSSLELSQN